MKAKSKSSTILKLVSVGKSYLLGETEVKAVDNVSLEINAGEFVSILGPSGSGKSTLMHIMGFLDKPTNGEVFLNGRKLANFSEGELAKIRNQTIGFVFQQFNLLQRASAVENVSLPLIYSGVSEAEGKRLAVKLLTELGMGDRLNNRPNQLSGGQQQRVAIARALIAQPQIVFADEPTGNLDSKSGDDVMALLEDLNRQGHTIVLVTHEAEVAAHARRQIYVRDGKVVTDTVKLKKKQ